MRRSRAWLCDGLIPILLLVGLTVPFWTTSLDLDIARAFYAPGEGWPRGSEQPWHALKHQGVIPAWVLVAAALGVFTSSFWSARATAPPRGVVPGAGDGGGTGPHRQRRLQEKLGTPATQRRV
jgi:hypothetical protein